MERLVAKDAGPDGRIIRVVGARQHNLRNIDVDIPRDRLVVLTGLSGSGKSSLAFDTIYAEGQRKYVESLSVHARYFLEQIGKPDVDRIDGLPPTLAIEQRATAANPRSTVATTTEIYDFLRVLYARIGQPHCLTCGREIFRRTVDQIVDAVLAYPAEARVMVLAPLVRGTRGDLTPFLKRIQREGFVRARVNGVLADVSELAERPPTGKTDVDAVVDRLIVRPEARRRLSDAVELSLQIGDGVVIVSRSAPGTDGSWTDELYSERFACPTCGVGLRELSPRAFSFNSPYGACEACSGLGTTLQFDAERIVPNAKLSLAAGALAPWSGAKRRMSAVYGRLLRELCAAFDVKPDSRFETLPDDLRRILLHGSRPKDTKRYGVEFEGVIPNLERRLRAAGSEGARSRFAAFQSECVCPVCRGARLRPEALAVRIAGRNIHALSALTIAQAVAWFEEFSPAGEAARIAEPLLREVRQRVRFLHEVGLGYLTLDRPSSTLSGGEAQRIRLATQLGSGLVGVCYVLDEPTIGLHQRDNERLLNSIRRLVQIGNTVLVVEHDEDVIRAADYLIDMGPGAGLHGGRVIAAGPPAEALANPASITGRYLRGEYDIPAPEGRRAIRRSEIVRVVGARENNLKAIDVEIPLGVLCAVTGVSGSGKSTLVSQILLPALRRRLAGRNGGGPAAHERVGLHENLIGASRVDRVVEIDQTPIGRSPRSNPATYTGVFDEIRRLYARTKEARVRGYKSSRFSFNVKGGRCEACQGQGVRRIEMHFLPDVFVECQECGGTRYGRDTLEIRYRGKSIADVLRMRVEDALKFFDSFARIRAGIQTLADVGLGYIELGQPSNTLSGGEAQRVKLAGELAKGIGLGPVLPTTYALADRDEIPAARQADGDESSNHDESGDERAAPAARRSAPEARPLRRAAYPAATHTLYVLDEPTTGLHFADIQTLLAVLGRLVDMGNTVLVIEHNLDVIKTADWIIDLGPDGGDAGGQVVCAGTPETVAACAASHTGRYLRRKLPGARHAG